MEYSSPEQVPSTADCSFEVTLLDRRGPKAQKCSSSVTRKVSNQESFNSEDSLLSSNDGRRCSVTFKEPDSSILIDTELDTEKSSVCEETSESDGLNASSISLKNSLNDNQVAQKNVEPESAVPNEDIPKNNKADNEVSKNSQITSIKTNITKQLSLNYDQPPSNGDTNFKRSYTVAYSRRETSPRPSPKSVDQDSVSPVPHDTTVCKKPGQERLPGEAFTDRPTPPPRKRSQADLSKFCDLSRCAAVREKEEVKKFSPFRRRASFMLKRSSWRASRFRSKSQGVALTLPKAETAGLQEVWKPATPGAVSPAPPPPPPPDQYRPAPVSRPSPYRASTTKSKWDRSDRKEDDSSSSVPRVEMVPESGGCPSAQESATQAAQEILISSPGSSKARQKKFHRHFKTVPPDEKVLNYYSCALVADILLQGHLYITRNYFAFYSNVFGYVTKLLIPTTSVLKVTKEKTAYIIPNAVGVTTEEDKHVFGSLLSRDNTYKLMVQVWNAALAPTINNTLPKPECIEERLKEELEEPGELQDEESSLSGSESNLESKLISNSVDSPPKGNTQKMGLEVKSYHDMFSQTTSSGGRAHFLTFLKGLPRPTLLLLISTGLLVLLFASATVLLYRIARLHQAPVDFSTRSMSEVHAYINSNLEHITKVRESLEKLSFLIEHGGKYHS